uniref:Uncharacterized protein n=1 Tax=Oryza brachyantha TaxID=4533 RepID=J3LCJ1_ORYBR
MAAEKRQTVATAEKRQTATADKATAEKRRWRRRRGLGGGGVPDYRNARTWFAYNGSDGFEVPSSLVLGKVFIDKCSWETFMTVATPCLLTSFDDWWDEIHQHLFAVPVSFYCNRIDSDYDFSDYESQWETDRIFDLGTSSSRAWSSPPPRGTSRTFLSHQALRAKIAVEAIPMEATSADIDAAIDAMADEQSGDNADQTTIPQPPPTGTTTSSPPKMGCKHKVITHRPYLRKPKDLDDFFSFDVGQYLDPSKADVDASATYTEQLTNILARLDYPVDTLINDGSPIK